MGSRCIKYLMRCTWWERASWVVPQLSGPCHLCLTQLFCWADSSSTPGHKRNEPEQPPCRTSCQERERPWQAALCNTVLPGRARLHHVCHGSSHNSASTRGAWLSMLGKPCLSWPVCSGKQGESGAYILILSFIHLIPNRQKLFLLVSLRKKYKERREQTNISRIIC